MIVGDDCSPIKFMHKTGKGKRGSMVMIMNKGGCCKKGCKPKKTYAIPVMMVPDYGGDSGYGGGSSMGGGYGGGSSMGGGYGGGSSMGGGYGGGSSMGGGYGDDSSMGGGYGGDSGSGYGDSGSGGGGY